MSNRPLTPQQELFCQNIASGMGQGDAYRAAGYICGSDSAAYSNGSRLIRHDKIAARVAELRAAVTAKTEVTLEWLIEQAQGILADARADKAHAAATGALKELGILTGQRVEKRETKHAYDPVDLDDDALADIARAGGAGASGPPARAPRSAGVH